MGLVRMAARTAVVAGTATAVSGRVQRRQYEKWEQQDAQQAAQQQAQAPPPPGEADPFCERHRQYFHRPADVRRSLNDAGFAVTAVSEEYTHRPADAETRCATWTSRRVS